MKIPFLKRKNKYKFNWIDFLGVFIFFAVLFIAVSFFLRKPSYTYVTLQISKGSKDDYYNFWFYKPTDWYIENLKIGMSDSNLLGKANLELVDMYYYPVNVASEQTVFVVLKVNAVYNKLNNQYSHQGKPLLIGDHRVFQLEKVSIPGLIRSISSELPEKVTQKVHIKGVFDSENNENILQEAEMRFIGLKNFQADKVVEGLTSYNTKGEELMKITKVNKTRGYREFIYQNSIARVPDPDRTVVEFEADLTLTEVNGHFLYKEEESVVLGKMLLFSPQGLDLYFVVEDVISN